MPDRADKYLLLCGILSYLAGQIWINASGSATKDVYPIDYIHWLMLIGAALMIPYAARLPRKGLSLLVSPLLLLGIILIIGMCIIDFVLWSFPEPELRSQVVEELMATGPVWKPFITYAGHIFTPALALASFVYWRKTKLGPLCAVAGMVVIGIWPIWSNPYGYALLFCAFLICFRAEARNDEQLVASG